MKVKILEYETDTGNTVHPSHNLTCKVDAGRKFLICKDCDAQILMSIWRLNYAKLRYEFAPYTGTQNILNHTCQYLQNIHNDRSIMKRNYGKSTEASDVVYFVGREVEHTSMFGQPTLFKVGERPLMEILEYVEKASSELQEEVKHIYFTANQSFKQIKDWSIVGELLNAGYTVTVDGEYKDIEKIIDQLPEHQDLIIMIAVPMTLSKIGHRKTFVKLDDPKPFMDNNSGVWVMPLSDLTLNDKCTKWEQYFIDKILARKSNLIS